VVNTNTNLPPAFPDNRETLYASVRVNNPNTLKKIPIINQNRKVSPIRVTITSKLNPDAVPFFYSTTKFTGKSKSKSISDIL